jgi:hypothetical protein
MPDGREDISTKPHQPVVFMLGRADGGAPIPADMDGVNVSHVGDNAAT